MAAQRGRDVLLKIDGGNGYETVAGLRLKRLALDAQSVEVTDAESAGRWRELLAGAGVRRASVSGSGIFKDAASDALLREAFFAGHAPACQVVVPDFGAFTFPMQVVRLEYAGTHDGEATFDITLESAGALTFEAEA